MSISFHLGLRNDNLKRLFLSIIFSTLLGISSAQELPKIVPPSPEAASLGKFADIPVSRYSGVPNISIPLYQIKVRDNSLPINLSYHASGIKVEEEASWVGLGWTLNAGGAITRMTRGMDDFLNESNHKGYLNSTQSPSSTPSKSYLEDVCLRMNDGEPDIFYFNFAGVSGKFYLERKVNGTDKVKVRLLSPEKIKIDYNETSRTWTVWDKNGYKYLFGSKEYTQVWNQSGTTPAQASSNLAPGVEPTDQKIISAWYLDKIVSPLGEEINFEYTTIHPYNGRKLMSRSILDISEQSSHCIGLAHLAAIDSNLCPLYKDGVSFNAGFGGKYGLIQMAPGYNSNFTSFDFSCLYSQATAWEFNYIHQSDGANIGGSCESTKSFHGSMRVVENIYLKMITFDGGAIQFISKDREDLQENIDPDHLILYGIPQRLDEIIVTSSSKIIRKIKLSSTYWNTQSPQNPDPFLNKRLRLDQVSESNGIESIPPHSFVYEELVQLPLKNSFARDHWGFYNGASNETAGLAFQPTLVPKVKYVTQDGQPGVIPGADREADELKSQAGVLKKIIYPTGGNTTFTYESNTFNVDQISTNLPTAPYSVSVNSESASTRATVFELKDPAQLTFNAELKCLGLACYTGGTPPNPAVNCSIINSGDYYLTVTKLSNGEIVWSGKNYDFYCMPGSGSNCQADQYNSSVSVSLCGIMKTKTIPLGAGKYLIKTSAPTGFVVTAGTSYTQSQQVTSYSTNLIKKGGGLRIKSVINHDGLSNSKNQVTSYNYHFTDYTKALKSAGKLMTFPKYAYAEYFAAAELAGGFTLLTRIKNQSYSNLPLGSSAQGGLIGYDKVEEITGTYGENGKTIFHYKNQPDEEPVPFFPNSPTITHSPSNGLMTKQEVFTANGFKVKEVLNDYGSQSNPNALGGISLMYSGGCYATTTPGYIFGDLIYKYYSEPSEWWYQIQSVERTFDQKDVTNTRFLTNTIDSFYDNPDHKQVTRTIATTSKGEQHSTFIYYPLDVPSLVPPQMWDEANVNYKHMHSSVIKQESFLASLRTAGLINNYAFNSYTTLIQPSGIDQALVGGNYETRLHFQVYDSAGNILQLKKSDNVTISYLWGYNKKLPIAQVLNATYAQVSAAIGSADLKLLKGNTLTPQQIRDKLSILRTALPGAQVTIITHDLLVGTVSVTDANNQSVFYEYDDLQRLLVIKDFEQQPVTKHKYVFKN